MFASTYLVRPTKHKQNVLTFIGRHFKHSIGMWKKRNWIFQPHVSCIGSTLAYPFQFETILNLQVYRIWYTFHTLNYINQTNFIAKWMNNLKIIIIKLSGASRFAQMHSYRPANVHLYTNLLVLLLTNCTQSFTFLIRSCSGVKMMSRAR